jgi:hypothetical protein
VFVYGSVHLSTDIAGPVAIGLGIVDGVLKGGAESFVVVCGCVVIFASVVATGDSGGDGDCGLCNAIVGDADGFAVSGRVSFFSVFDDQVFKIQGIKLLSLFLVVHDLYERCHI